MSSRPADAHTTSFAKFYNSETFSDFTLVCNRRAWKVRRILLAIQSGFFSREAQDRKMQLRQDDEDAVAAMIYYFYHGDDEEQVSNRSGSSANVSSKVFAVADKYIASGLRVFAVRKFTEALALLPLESEDFATTIAEGYASRGEEIDAPPNAICQGLLNFTNQNASVLFSGCPGFIRFREVTWFTPAFAADLHVIKQHVIFEPVNLSQPHNSRSQQRRTYPTERRPPYGSLHL